MSKPAPHPPFAEALYDPEFRQALPRIAAYAARSLRRVGWPEGRDHKPGAAETDELVNDAIATCLEGGRTWNEEQSLEAFVCSVIWSQVSHKKRATPRGRMLPLDDEPEPAAPPSRRDERLGAYHLVQRIKQEIAGDLPMEELLASMERGVVKPAAGVASLGWTPGRVKAVREKMDRRLAAAGLEKDEDDDGPEREEGPRDAPAPRGISRRRAAQ